MRVAILALALGLAGCMAEAQEGADAPLAYPETEADCIAAGGTWARGGLSPHPICFLPNPDAGESCARSSDCVGVCLAETRTCSTMRPLFGCYGFLDENGDKVVICVD